MKKYVAIIGLFLSVLQTGCIDLSDVFPKDVELQGKAGVTKVLTGAACQLETVPASEPVTMETDSAGVFSTVVPSSTSIEGYVVRATGGFYDGNHFWGTLKAYVPKDQLGQPVYVNVMSTLIAQLMSINDLSYDDAVSEIRSFLKIPETVTDITNTDDPILRSYFHPAVFLAEAASFGGFDSFVSHLIGNEIGGAATRSFAGYPRTMAANNDNVEIGSSIGSKILDGIANGLGGFVATKAVGWITSLFSFGPQGITPEEIEESLAEMQDQLDGLCEQITEIEESLQDLSSQVDQVLAAVELTRDEIIADTESLNLKDHEDVINMQFEFLRDQFNSDKDYAFTDVAKDRARTFCLNLLRSDGYDIDQQLYHMHSAIMGEAVGATGLLQSLTNVLIDKVNQGEDITQAYLALEYYFSELVAIEAKGMMLISEALHFLEDDNVENPAYWRGSAEDYYTQRFQPRLNEQAAFFLNCVCQLVLSQVDIRTIIVGDQVTFLPPQISDPITSDIAERTGLGIIERADFILTQFSSDQPFGQTFYLIGDPNNIKELVEYWYLTVKWKRDKWHSTSYCLDYVPINGQDYLEFTPKVPSYYPQATYLEWHLRNTDQYRIADKIRVAKLKISHSDSEIEDERAAVKQELMSTYKYDEATADQMVDDYINRGWMDNKQYSISLNDETYDAIAIGIPMDSNFTPVEGGTFYDGTYCCYGNVAIPVRYVSNMVKDVFKISTSPDFNDMDQCFSLCNSTIDYSTGSIEGQVYTVSSYPASSQAKIHYEVYYSMNVRPYHRDESATLLWQGEARIEEFQYYNHIKTFHVSEEFGLDYQPRSETFKTTCDRSISKGSSTDPVVASTEKLISTPIGDSSYGFQLNTKVYLKGDKTSSKSQSDQGSYLNYSVKFPRLELIPE